MVSEEDGLRRDGRERRQNAQVGGPDPLGLVLPLGQRQTEGRVLGGGAGDLADGLDCFGGRGHDDEGEARGG